MLVWAALAAAVAVPVIVAANSPFLAYRDAVYIIAGFAGICGLALLLVQPLLAARALPGLSPRASRRLHRAGGVALVAAVGMHVGGLWLTSPPDVVDALRFASPTPFSVWGVIAMWAVFAAAALAALRKRLSLRLWQSLHRTCALVIVGGTVVHALLIVGAMGPVTKMALCILVGAAALWAGLMRPLRLRRARRSDHGNAFR